ncbi:MAG: hypothetical protein EXR95_00090 [Gemmatimonadetes bacterium]|nr:hypothetical protein [Gemmatimonadota bacterium]MSR35030.1 hypothetical protein [Gemmatimonadota bacterium]
MSHSGPPQGHSPANGRLRGPLPLVGRTRELAALESLLEVGRDDGTSVVIVSGEGGVGKSRLAQELGARAARRGWKVAYGRAFPVETGVPYALFADAFLPILRELDPATLTLLTRGGADELRYLFPALGQRGLEAEAPSGEPDEVRTRLMWDFAEFLKSYAARSPLLCILEDLQWADESSLHLLHFLARQGQRQPILILGTYNDTQRDRSLQLVQTERSLVSLGVGELRRLESLTLDQVNELVCVAFGVDADVVREFSALLFGWTRGNPFFLEEILKALVESGRLTSASGVWVGWDAHEFRLPGSIRDAVLARVGGLSENSRSIADVAAIIGGRARYALLASISGLAESELLEALEELCAHRILDERAEAETVVYDFTHPLVRQTLYDEFGLQHARASSTGGSPRPWSASTRTAPSSTRTSSPSTSRARTRPSCVPRRRSTWRPRGAPPWLGGPTTRPSAICGPRWSARRSATVTRRGCGESWCHSSPARISTSGTSRPRARFGRRGSRTPHLTVLDRPISAGPAGCATSGADATPRRRRSWTRASPRRSAAGTAPRRCACGSPRLTACRSSVAERRRWRRFR